MSMNDEREHNLMVAIFSVAAGMVGVCLTGIGLLQVVSSVRKVSTFADDLLAVDALLFLACCLFGFLSFRVRAAALQGRLRKAADASFFVGLVMMAAIAGLLTWAFI